MIHKLHFSCRKGKTHSTSYLSAADEIGLDKKLMMPKLKQYFSVRLVIFSNPSILTNVLGAQNNRLMETVI